MGATCSLGAPMASHHAHAFSAWAPRSSTGRVSGTGRSGRAAAPPAAALTAGRDAILECADRRAAGRWRRREEEVRAAARRMQQGAARPLLWGGRGKKEEWRRGADESNLALLPFFLALSFFTRRAQHTKCKTKSTCSLTHSPTHGHKKKS